MSGLPFISGDRMFWSPSWNSLSNFFSPFSPKKAIYIASFVLFFKLSAFILLLSALGSIKFGKG